jgi:Mitochondrial mRNA-processing protein COX24, C-terminal
VLPLHHPRIVIDDSGRSGRFRGLLVGSATAMGSLIKKRRKRMRKKKHKKLLKKTRWQRRQQGK